MKVLENNYEKVARRNTTWEIVCNYCGSVLEVGESDIEYGEYGCSQITCPCCGNINDDLEAIPEKRLTVENLSFPKHFRHLSAEDGAADVFDKDVLKTIKDQIKFLRQYPEESFCGGWVTGNLMSIVMRYDGDEQFIVLVSKDFYETAIPFNENDIVNIGRKSCN